MDDLEPHAADVELRWSSWRGMGRRYVLCHRRLAGLVVMMDLSRNSCACDRERELDAATQTEGGRREIEGKGGGGGLSSGEIVVNSSDVCPLYRHDSPGLFRRRGSARMSFASTALKGVLSLTSPFMARVPLTRSRGTEWT